MDRAGAAIGEIFVRAVIQDLALTQVALKQGELLADPVDELFGCRHVISIHQIAVIDQSQTRQTLQRNNPEPESLAHKMVCRQPDGQVAGGRTIRTQSPFP